jgi:adenylylsulfate kinase
MKECFEIIATINTEKIDKELLPKYVADGATIFRINAAFLKIDEVKDVIDSLRRVIGKTVKILVDLPGYKLRFLYLDEEIPLKAGASFTLKKGYFNYPDFFDAVKKGTSIRFNNGFNSFTITGKKDDSIECLARNDGVITRGKGLHIDNVSYRPAANSLPDFDLAVLKSLHECDVDYAGLSFVHDREDIEYIKKKLGSSRIECIPKIESRESMRNLASILTASKMVILDRGDLAGEIGLGLIGKAQKEVISLGKLLGCRVILATQVLASMIKNPLPTISEVDSLHQAFHAGIDGVQLSEEISVGERSRECIQFIRSAIEELTSHAGEPAGKIGPVFWIMGLTSSGKSSVAQRIAEKLKARGVKVLHYDGDDVRNMFGADFGFAPEDRLKVVKNLGYLANKTAGQGFNVLVSALTAHTDARKHIRENVNNLVTVFLKCGVQECARRDPKGLYKKARKGEINTLVGFNAPYDAPEFADLIVDTENSSIEEAADRIIGFMIEKEFLIR